MWLQPLDGHRTYVIANRSLDAASLYLQIDYGPDGHEAAHLLRVGVAPPCTRMELSVQSAHLAVRTPPQDRPPERTYRAQFPDRQGRRRKDLETGKHRHVGFLACPPGSRRREKTLPPGGRSAHTPPRAVRQRHVTRPASQGSRTLFDRVERTRDERCEAPGGWPGASCSKEGVHPPLGTRPSPPTAISPGEASHEHAHAMGALHCSPLCRLLSRQA